MISSTRWRVKSGEWKSHTEQSNAAQRLLAELIGHPIVVEHDTEGAPYLPDHPELHISISHCRTAVAVAINQEGKVGIDVECRRKISDGLIGRVCTAAEREALRNSDDATMDFLRYWTRKEAVLKMRGTGIKGFGSMIEASTATDCLVEELDTGLPDTVATLATAL